MEQQGQDRTAGTLVCRGCMQDRDRLGPTGYCRVCFEVGIPASARSLPPAPAKLVGRWPMDVLRMPAAADRLRKASADLAEVRAELAHDAERAFQAAARREQERAMRRESEALHYRMAVDGVDDVDLVSQAPGLYRARHQRQVAP